MTTPLFTGIGVALVTLFDEDGRLVATATAELAAQLVDLGVKAVVVAGSTGEAAALSQDERDVLVRAVRAAVPATSGVPVIVGTGAATANGAAALTRRARHEGADGLLVLSPPGSHDLPGYYNEVSEAAGDLAVIGYHFPEASSPGIPLDQLSALPISGCKDSTADADRLLRTLASWDRPLYTGSSALLSLAGPAGCTGAILALANAQPELCRAAFEGDMQAQLQLVDDHLAVAADFPAQIKRLTAGRFRTSSTVRLAKRVPRVTGVTL